MVTLKNHARLGELIRKLPKADLHVHLDGSLRLETLIELAQDAGVKLPSYTPEGLRELVFKDSYANLNEYLEGFGYTVAVIAGFLLTAVRNWTGMHTPDGLPLLALVLLWLAGRALPFWAAVPPLAVAAVDLAFLPALALALARPLWNGRNKHNRWFLLLLAAMTAANAMVHAQALGWTADSADRGVDAMLGLVVVILVFVGGRVMPFFTEMAVAGSTPRGWRWIELSGVSLLVLAAALQAAGLGGWPLGLVLLAAALVQAVRLAGWHDLGVWRIPILWVLYTGYGWLVVGLALLGASHLGVLPRSPAVHALTVGAIGVLTLGMMARVSLGHTGRQMRSSPVMNTAFVVINLAAAVRILGPVLMPSWYVSWVVLSGLLWMIAFTLFTIVYAPVLLRARVDGKPG